MIRMPAPTIVGQHAKDKTPNNVITGIVGVDVADYGGAFAGYTPPDPLTETESRYVEDTHASTGGKRLYLFANAKWSYVTLT